MSLSSLAMTSIPTSSFELFGNAPRLYPNAGLDILSTPAKFRLHIMDNPCRHASATNSERPDDADYANPHPGPRSRLFSLPPV